MHSLTRSLLLLACLTAHGGEALAAPFKLKLKYFDARGAAELTRVLLAIGGEDFEDHRYQIGPGFEAPEFQRDKEAGALGANLGRAPVLELDGGGAAATIGQSRAMERFVARRTGLMGASELDAARIDALAEHVRDVKDAQARKGFSAMARDKDDAQKAQLKAEWFETDLPGWLARIEACVVAGGASGGRCVGAALSYADVCIWSLLRDGAPADAALVRECEASSCEVLTVIADAVAAHPAVVAWLEKRPVTNF